MPRVPPSQVAAAAVAAPSGSRVGCGWRSRRPSPAVAQGKPELAGVVLPPPRARPGAGEQAMQAGDLIFAGSQQGMGPAQTLVGQRVGLLVADRRGLAGTASSLTSWARALRSARKLLGSCQLGHRRSRRSARVAGFMASPAGAGNAQGIRGRRVRCAGNTPPSTHLCGKPFPAIFDVSCTFPAAVSRRHQWGSHLAIPMADLRSPVRQGSAHFALMRPSRNRSSIATRSSSLLKPSARLACFIISGA